MKGVLKVSSRFMMVTIFLVSLLAIAGCNDSTYIPDDEDDSSSGTEQEAESPGFKNNDDETQDDAESNRLTGDVISEEEKDGSIDQDPEQAEDESDDGVSNKSSEDDMDEEQEKEDDTSENTKQIILDEEYDYDKRHDIYEGETHRIRINNSGEWEEHELILQEVARDGEMRFRFDGELLDYRSNGEMIEIDRGHYIELGHGLYNEPWRDMPSIAELRYHEEDFESYPEILIETDIGPYTYKMSEKNSKTYKTTYSNNMVVEVIKDFDFLDHHKDGDSLELYGDYDYIYVRRDEDSNVQEITWFSHNATVRMNKRSDLVIGKYLDRYPSLLSERMYCTEEHMMKEGEARDFNVDGKSFNLEVVALEDEKILFEVNSEKEWFQDKERDDIYHHIDLEIKKLDTFPKKTDEVKFCLIY